NTANIPSAAIARTEILKDGAAVIYGADATGGVVNFITRDDFVGLEANAQYKYIDGSDGDYGLSLLGGVGDDNINFMWSLEWDHRSRLETEDRDFASRPYAVNPAAYSALTNVASWLPLGARPTSFNRATYDAGLALSRPYAGELGNPVAGLQRDFTQSSCEAVAGIYNPNGVATGVPACMYNYISYYNLVEENDIYRGYAQFNGSINENMDFHIDASYGQVKSPQVFGSPAQPVIRGPAVSTGATYQFYVPSTNPYASAFLDQQVANGGMTQGIRNATGGLAALTYRAFAHGGNPFLGEGNGYGVPSKIDNQIWRVSGGINGNLGEWAGPLSEVGYDLALTYNQSISYADSPDVIGYRLQDALAGFGGPSCSLPDQNPNQFGIQNTSVAATAAARAAFNCYYWNPFASAFANQPELGLDNPRYVAGAENRADVAKWLFDARATETVNSNLTADLVFNGDSPITLPGGTIGWALGGQVRQIEFREVVNSDLYNGNTPCDTPPGQTIGVVTPDGPDAGTDPDVSPTPNIPRAITDPLFTGCTLDAGGPFVFFGTNPPDYADQQQYSLFGELQIPVFDNLNFQAAVRREEFSGGLGSTVYKVSGKWDVWGPLSIRGSYGTNYQAPPAGLIPGDIANGVNSFTRASGAWLGAQTVTRADIVPETATAANMGVIWQSQGFAADHDLRVIVDYFDIETEDELGLLASANDIAAGVFRYGASAAGLANPTDANAFADRQGTTLSGATAVNNGTAYADCSHPLVASGRVLFNGGGCTQGTTQANALNSIRTDYGNGPGQHIAGFDVQINYTLPIAGGDLTLGLTATQVTKDENSASTIDGFEIKPIDDRLGDLNFATVGDASPELRGNIFANYRMDQHNFRLTMQYISGVDDERGPIALDGYL
ncbi:MAG: TonB-dependent receptor, partial [Alphaproteobacteria bacterium]